MIELFKGQQNLYDDILKKTRSNNINVADLKLQIKYILKRYHQLKHQQLLQSTETLDLCLAYDLL